MQKSANKRWRESGTSLGFKEWLKREDSKMLNSSEVEFIPFAGGSDMSKSADATIVTTPIDNTFLGINKNYLYAAGVIVLVSVVIAYTHKKKK